MPHGVPIDEEKVAEFRAKFLYSGNASASGRELNIPDLRVMQRVALPCCPARLYPTHFPPFSTTTIPSSSTRRLVDCLLSQMSDGESNAGRRRFPQLSKSFFHPFSNESAMNEIHCRRHSPLPAPNFIPQSALSPFCGE